MRMIIPTSAICLSGMRTGRIRALPLSYFSQATPKKLSSKSVTPTAPSLIDVDRNSSQRVPEAANPESDDSGRGAGENGDDEDRDEKQGRSYSRLSNSPMPLKRS